MGYVWADLAWLGFSFAAYAISLLSSDEEKKGACWVLSLFTLSAFAAKPFLLAMPEAYYLLMCAYEVAMIRCLMRYQSAAAKWLSASCAALVPIHAIQGILYSASSIAFYDAYCAVIIAVNVSQLLIILSCSDRGQRVMDRIASVLGANHNRV